MFETKIRKNKVNIKLLISEQTYNDCGPLSLLYTELAILDEPQRIGNFNFDQAQITNLRLAQKEVIKNDKISWRIRFESRPLRRIKSQSSNSESSDDLLNEPGKMEIDQSTPHRKRRAPTTQDKLHKIVRKRLHLAKNRK